ncbi:hypothetical protein K7957_15190 [Sphingomonas yunnanensis]|uniref:hypothetical protein n=1 Tax=Sphingomonas yunnanensis TaxID=310400 RepID=UPI001CA7AB8C|nr:hypothetical protein [Sphingomonas yunnanensis]MBY9064282.1 hypothetical protein [Sphingomonas yunnanensis]
MAILDSLAGFIDNTGLAEAFAARAEDPAKARRPLLDGIRRTREQFAARASEAARVGSRWWQLQNGVVALTVKIGGDVLPLNGAATNHLPEGVFAAFLDALEQAVEAGELDETLRARQAERTRPARGAEPAQRQRVPGRHPSNDRDDWDSLTWAQRQKVSAFYREGRNPDGSVIATVGYRPDAPITG